MKNKTTAGLFGIFLGIFGVHKFYLGQTNMGIVYLLCGTLGTLLVLPFLAVMVISLVEGIILLTQTDQEFDDQYNDGVSSAVPSSSIQAAYLKAVEEGDDKKAAQLLKAIK